MNAWTKLHNDQETENDKLHIHTHPFARGRAEDAKSTKYLQYV